ncbi:MAG: hypothetical protein QW303_00515 [Nitrososphaerota archaeon]
MKDIIIEESIHLNKEQKIYILTMVKSEIHAIIESNDGTCVNLDKISNVLISNIYEYIKKELDL